GQGVLEFEIQQSVSAEPGFCFFRRHREHEHDVGLCFLVNPNSWASNESRCTAFCRPSKLPRADFADFRDRVTFLFRPQLLPSILRNSLVFQASEVWELSPI